MAQTASGGSRKIGRIRARNRGVILEAATRIFAENGFGGTSITEIAQAAGLPKTNIYYYFKTKEEIYDAIFDELRGAWNDALRLFDEGSDPAAAISAYIRAKLDYSRRHGPASKIFTIDQARGQRIVSQSDREFTRRAEIVVKAWIKAGKMDPIDPKHFFMMLWGTTQFYANYDSVAREEMGLPSVEIRDFDKAAETILHIVLKGCGIRPAAQSRAKRKR